MPGLRDRHRPRVRLPLLPGLRVGTVRVSRVLLDERRRGTRFVHLPIKSILNSPQQTGMGFWSLNPYVGCEFGCMYCYARFAHRYVVERGRQSGEPRAGAWDDEAFERQVFVKSEAPDILALTLKPSRLGDAAIAIGTATDPYQPAERRFRLTRRILERLTQFHGLNVSLVTKSPLVSRDLDVLARLAERSRLTVYLSLITVEVPLIKKLEARSPMPAVRLRALEKLARGGIRAGVMIAPVVPGVTDGAAQLLALMQAAKAAGASFVHAEPLRLYPATRPRFLSVIARHFPTLLPRYEQAFDARGSIREEYARALERRVERLQRQTGFWAPEDAAAAAAARYGRRATGRLDDLGQWALL
jgi:DNA repair photolyase